MKRIVSYHVLVLVIISLVTVPRTTEGILGEESAGTTKQKVTGVVEEVCGKTTSKDVCVETLEVDPLVVFARAKVTAKDLAISFLRTTAKNATDFVYELKTLMEDDKLEPQVQQGLSDCSDMLVDAGDQIDIALNAITAGAAFDTKRWLQVATDATDLCKNSLEEGNQQVMLAKANGFHHLCIIASDICNQL